jgi:hypothetical protein
MLTPGRTLTRCQSPTAKSATTCHLANKSFANRIDWLRSNLTCFSRLTDHADSVANLLHQCWKLSVNREPLRSKCTCIPQNCIFTCWSTKAIPATICHLAIRSFTNLLDLLTSKWNFIRQNRIFICQSSKANAAKLVTSPSQVSRPNSICWDQSGLVSADWLIMLTSGRKTFANRLDLWRSKWICFRQIERLRWLQWRTYHIGVHNCHVFGTHWDQSWLVFLKIVFSYADRHKRFQPQFVTSPSQVSRTDSICWNKFR